jgi:hypothetical protein
MSYARFLAQPRTVRFSKDVDRKLVGRAGRKGTTVSALIRESVLRDLQADEESAGEWVRRVAKQRATGKRKPDSAFVKGWQKRHS